MMNKRTLAVIVYLSIFVARTHTKGENQTFVESNFKQQSRMGDELESKFTVFKEQTFLEGSNVTLKCNSPEVKWSELIYIIWNISLQSKKCWLGIESSIQNSTCNDGKMLLNSSDGVSLFIPKISKEDEGSYLCHVSYNGGGYRQKVNVSVHHFTSWLEDNNGQKMAVCAARYEQHEPTLQWKPALNFSSNISYYNNSDMSFVVKNQVYLPDNVTISNLTCLATYPTKKQPQNIINPGIILIATGSICFIVVFLTVAYILHRKLNNLSAIKMLCCKSKISTPAEDKPPQPPDVEEVEPYASYIQRVNSIYNSSSELFNT